MVRLTDKRISWCYTLRRTGHRLCGVSLPRALNLNVIREKQSEKSYMRSFLKTHLDWSFKMSMSWRPKKGKKKKWGSVLVWCSVQMMFCWVVHLKLVWFCEPMSPNKFNKKWGKKKSPSWCGSVDWVPACQQKGCCFHSQSGHMPGLWAGSPVGGDLEATTHGCFSPSLSPYLPLFKNK